MEIKNQIEKALEGIEGKPYVETINVFLKKIRLTDGRIGEFHLKLTTEIEDFIEV
jgi:hypothetical protein